jgi:hypothetical protein
MRVKLSDRLLRLKYTLYNHEYYTYKKHDNRYFINAVHHSQVEIRSWLTGARLSENPDKISKHFSHSQILHYTTTILIFHNYCIFAITFLQTGMFAITSVLSLKNTSNTPFWYLEEEHY